MEYILAIGLVLIGIYSYRKMTSVSRKLYFSLILFYVILLVGFRYKVGIDTLNYMNGYPFLPSFENIWNKYIFEERFEPGYLFVCGICKLITPEFWLVQLVMGAITNSCIFLFLYRNCKNPFIGIFLYFIFQCLYFSVEIIREGAAVGIFLVNYKNIESKRLIKYYLLSLLSIAFHYSAIIIWLIPLIRYLHFNYIYICLLLVLFLITPLVSQLNSHLTFLSIAGRVESSVEGAETLNFNWRVAEFIKSAFPSITTLYVMHKYKIDEKFKRFALLQILFCAGAFAIPIIFARFTNYTSVFIVVLMANLLYSSRLSTTFKSWFVCFLLLSQANYYRTMKDAWIPYVSIFDPYTVQQREDLWWKYFHS